MSWQMTSKAFSITALNLDNDFNHFYHEVKILSEENEEKKKGYLALLMLTRDVLESCIHVLGFTSPERM